MTTGDEESTTERSALKRTADILRARPNSQKLGALGAIALLISAPFGGLAQVQTPPEPLVQDQTYDIGPMDLTITGVSSVPTLEPALAPAPGNRLFVVRMDVRNISDQAVYPTQLASAVSGSGVGAVPFQGEAEPQPQILTVADGQPLDEINPGVEYDLVLVLEQAGDWEPQEVELSITTFYFQADDPLTGDPNRWRLGSDQLVGDFTVRVRS